MRLSKLHHRYLQELKGLGRAPLTIATYESDFCIFLEFLGRDDTRALTDRVASGFLAWLARCRDPNQRLRQGHAPGSIARRVASVSGFCKWLAKRKDILANPFDSLPRPKRPRGLPRAVPTEIIDRFLKMELTTREGAIVSGFRYAGLRVSEIINLDTEDVDFLLNCLAVRKGKGGVDRTIPVDPALPHALEEWCRERGDALGAMFAGQQGPRLNRKAVGRMLNCLCKHACIPRFCAHQLRHTFGTEAASAGAPATDLQQLMGHDELATTQGYLRVTSCDLERPMARLKAWRKAKDSVEPMVQQVIRSQSPGGNRQKEQR